MKPVAQILRSTKLRPALAVTLAVLSFAATPNLRAQPVVKTLFGGITQANPSTYYGFANGVGSPNNAAQFHTPCGIALDGPGSYLFVADRDNNAIRYIDLAANQTYTFTTNLISQPVGVALDGAGNIYVLNRGSANNISTNGTILKFAPLAIGGDLIATNATGLTNVAGIALDSIGNIYVTVQSNTLIQISPAGVRTTIATITNAGTSLQGIIVKHDGRVAACDSGRNGVCLIDPNTGVVTNQAGFHGAGDFTSANNVSSAATAQFNQPYGVAEAGDGALIITDNGNHRVKVVLTSGIVTNLYGISSNLWYAPSGRPGWRDGTAKVPDAQFGVEARLPRGIVFASDGSVYTSEDYYHIIRKVTSTGLALPPPPPPQVPAPVIGWVDFTSGLSSLVTGTSFVLNNDVTIAIRPGTNSSQVFYTTGQTPSTGSIPDPSPANGATPPSYADGLASVTDLGATRYPDMLIKAIGTKNDGSPNSAIVQARFQFVTANPIITGNNAAQFTITDQTVGAQMWYTTDGTDPTNAPPSIGPILSGTSLSLGLVTNTTFRIRAFRANYQPSGSIANLFQTNNYTANGISFGFASGEASSDFIASPGQIFFSPVTLSILPATVMFSLQFNLTVTNGGPNPGPSISAGAYDFRSMLKKPLPPDTNFPGVVIYTAIPPYMFIANAVNPPPPGQIVNYNGTNFVNLEIANTNLNLLSVGWLERAGAGKTNLFNTAAQDLIQYSMAHDTLFLQDGGKIILGGYAFQVPANATPSQTYQIQIGRPSATSDGFGAPGSDIYIATPINGSLAGGPINSIKVVTVGQRKYVAGDVYPFRWFNAGDFGETNLNSADVAQVFQSAIYNLNNPPAGSDFFDGMDSCCVAGAASPGGYWQPTGAAAQNPLYDGNDTTINTVAFGDGVLDVSDVYVTFRRSLDPSLTWFERFWTNGVRGALPIPNSPGTPLLAAKPLAQKSPTPIFGGGGSTPVANVTNVITPGVTFTAGDAITGAGQTLQIPITAQVFGSYPIRKLMLNLTVTPLDGSPAITTPVQFKFPALGTPDIVTSQGTANYAAVWLNNSNGFSGTIQLGVLQITLPSNAPTSSAYAIHFDHASASPNGLASFPRKTFTGLITLADRSTSSWLDGIPDSWRLRWFGTIYNQLSARTADADGDGADSWHEYNAGTDPNDSTSVLRVSTQGLTVHWPSVANRTYVVESSSSLFGGTWTSIVTNTGTGTDMQYQDNRSGARFYRVRVSP